MEKQAAVCEFVISLLLQINRGQDAALNTAIMFPDEDLRFTSRRLERVWHVTRLGRKKVHTEF
jgi:hypothetical protein